MSAVYPRGPAPVAEAPPFDAEFCAAELILLRELRPEITKVLAAGKVIHKVGGRVFDIYRVWDEIEAERKAFEAVPLQAEGDYMEALSGLAVNLDPFVWIAGLRGKLGVSEIVAPKEL